MHFEYISLWVIGLCVAANSLHATEPIALTEANIRQAIDRSLPLLQKSMQGSLEQRKQCFTCHHQGLGILTLSLAQSCGLSVDKELLQTQAKSAAEFLQKNRDRFLEGRGTGGEMDTAGYALWALTAANWPADETTAAVAEYLLLVQPDSDHWQNSSNRPPSESSPFTSTYLSLRGLKSYAIAAQQERADKRFAKTKEWLLQTTPQETEEHVFRLRSLHLLQATPAQIQSATQELLKLQRADGGFSQTAELESDAYATGSALVAIHQAGGLPTSDAAYQKGLTFLISSQQDDGSWLVKSRSVPFQTYFESGYPHGKDQFISMAAGCWSTMALALALPVNDVD